MKELWDEKISAYSMMAGPVLGLILLIEIFMVCVRIVPGIITELLRRGAKIIDSKAEGKTETFS